MEWIHEVHYAEEMEKTAEPYLAKRRKDLFFPVQQNETEKAPKLHVVRYTADQP